jgi:hypothetical protein
MRREAKGGGCKGGELGNAGYENMAESSIGMQSILLRTTALKKRENIHFLI